MGVTRDGGFEDYFTAPEEVVYHVPDNVSLEAAAVIEPISCAMHAVDLLTTHPYQNALIIGDGFEGQLICQILKARGVREVTLAGTSDDKLANNRKHFGFKTINNIKEPDAIKPDSYDIC